MATTKVKTDHPRENGVFSCTWKENIKGIAQPRAVCSCNSAGADGKPGEGVMVSWPVVQADPNDKILLAEVDGEKIIHAHPWIWRHTIDQYLYHYNLLLDQQMQFGSELTEACGVVDSMLHQRVITGTERRKPLPPMIAYEPFGMSNKRAKQSWKIQAPKLTKNAHHNLLARWLEVRKNDEKRMGSLYFDGLPLHIEDRGDGKSVEFVRAAGQFTLADYIWHELMTGISLSIEIAAVLLEFENDLQREDALQWFKEDALPWVVASPMIFTRICAARCYFHQIQMDNFLEGYLWRGGDMADGEQMQRVRAKMLVLDALTACEAIRTVEGEQETWQGVTRPVFERVLDEDLEPALEHLADQIKRMKKPVDIFAYVDHPEHGLAIFCNPEHSNMQVYLKALKVGQEKKRSYGPDSKTMEFALFRKVHAMVREAIWNCYRNPD